MKLVLSNDLSLPPDFVTQTGAIIARKRRGKTYTGSVLFEELVKAKIPAVVVDPTGAWWGLRASADGKHEGLPVTILGGEHGDIPLERGAGKVIADLVVDHPGHYVVDTSDFDTDDMHFFLADFGERLFKRKKGKRFPMHLFGDEADVIVPQTPESKEHTRCSRAFDKINRRGGLYGLGFTMITQRPALVNKNSLSQVEVLIVLQLIAEHDRAPVERWVRTHDTGSRAETFMASLASLGLGEAWVWSPSWLNIFKKVQVRERDTFNSSKTPEVGDRLIEPTVLAPVDLDAVKARVAATIEKAKSNDPVALKQELEAVKRQLAARAAAVPLPPKQIVGKETFVDVPVVLAKDLKALEAALVRAQKLQEKSDASRDKAMDIALKIENALRQAQNVSARPVPPKATFVPLRPTYQPSARHHKGGINIPPRAHRLPSAPPSDLTRPQLKILGALLFLESLGVMTPSKTQVALYVGASPTSSTYANNLGALRSKGYVDYPNAGLALTEAGRDCAPTSDIPQTHEALLDLICSNLTNPQQIIVRYLAKKYPLEVAKVDLAEAIGASNTSSTFANNLGALRTMGIITYPAPNFTQAAKILFPTEAVPA